jgi:hypothetical protein
MGYIPTNEVNSWSSTLPCARTPRSDSDGRGPQRGCLRPRPPPSRGPLCRHRCSSEYRCPGCRRGESRRPRASRGSVAGSLRTGSERAARCGDPRSGRRALRPRRFRGCRARGNRGPRARPPAPPPTGRCSTPAAVDPCVVRDEARAKPPYQVQGVGEEDLHAGPDRMDSSWRSRASPVAAS